MLESLSGKRGKKDQQAQQQGQQDEKKGDGAKGEKKEEGVTASKAQPTTASGSLWDVAIEAVLVFLMVSFIIIPISVFLWGIDAYLSISGVSAIAVMGRETIGIPFDSFWGSLGRAQWMLPVVMSVVQIRVGIATRKKQAVDIIWYVAWVASVGVDVYTTFQGAPVVLHEAGWWRSMFVENIWGRWLGTVFLVLSPEVLFSLASVTIRNQFNSLKTVYYRVKR